MEALTAVVVAFTRINAKFVKEKKFRIRRT